MQSKIFYIDFENGFGPTQASNYPHPGVFLRAYIFRPVARIVYDTFNHKKGIAAKRGI